MAQRTKQYAIRFHPREVEILERAQEELSADREPPSISELIRLAVKRTYGAAA